MGASHGRSRNFNVTYVDPAYQAMLREAAVLWRELEDESGASLLDLVGVTNHGAGVAPDLADELGALGVRASMLTPAEAQERWAGIRFDTRVLYTAPTAGGSMRRRRSRRSSPRRLAAEARSCSTPGSTRSASVRTAGSR